MKSDFPESPMPQQILIAEDEPNIRDFLVAVLSGAGFETIEASDGAAVLTRLAYPPPALVLMDLHMPMIDGLEAFRRLLSVKSWDSVPVLFLTASGYTDNLVAARRLGARGYLLKPIRSVDLLARVRQVLDDPNLLWLDDITQARSV